jgi:hypothetical protein
VEKGVRIPLIPETFVFRANQNLAVRAICGLHV